MVLWELLAEASPLTITARIAKGMSLSNSIHNGFLRHLLGEEPPLKPKGALARQKAFSACLYLLSLSLAPHVIQDRGLISLSLLFLVAKAQGAIECDSLLGQSL